MPSKVLLEYPLPRTPVAPARQWWPHAKLASSCRLGSRGAQTPACGPIPLTPDPHPTSQQLRERTAMKSVSTYGLVVLREGCQ
jgi:hypothetical protein